MRLYKTKYNDLEIIVDNNSAEKINRGDDEEYRECDGYHSPHHHATGYNLDGEEIDESICLENTEGFDEWLSEKDQKDFIKLTQKPHSPHEEIK